MPVWVSCFHRNNKTLASTLALGIERFLFELVEERKQRVVKARSNAQNNSLIFFHHFFKSIHIPQTNIFKFPFKIRKHTCH